MDASRERQIRVRRVLEHRCPRLIFELAMRDVGIDREIVQCIPVGVEIMSDGGRRKRDGDYCGRRCDERGSGGAAEIVSQSGGGVLFDDERDLPDALIRLGADASFAVKLGDKARDDFDRRYRLETHLDRYLALIDEVH